MGNEGLDRDPLSEKKFQLICYNIKVSCQAERSFSEHFEDELVKILVSVIKAEFALFQMKVKCVFCQPTKAHKARLGEGPEVFNAINI